MSGDGTGPEVVAEGIKVLEGLSHRYGLEFKFQTYPLGEEPYLRRGNCYRMSALEIPEPLGHTLEFVKKNLLDRRGLLVYKSVSLKEGESIRCIR